MTHHRRLSVSALLRGWQPERYYDGIEKSSQVNTKNLRTLSLFRRGIGIEMLAIELWTLSLFRRGIGIEMLAIELWKAEKAWRADQQKRYRAESRHIKEMRVKDPSYAYGEERTVVGRSVTKHQVLCSIQEVVYEDVMKASKGARQ